MSPPTAIPSRFRLRLTPLLRPCAWFVGVLLLANVGVAAVAQWRALGSVSLSALGPATVLPLALGALLATLQVLVVLACPVRVLPDALRGFNLWGGYKTVKWGDIPEVSTGSLLRMRYLKVPVPASSLPITVPFALADLPGFLAAVETCAGREHPLAVALRDGMGPAHGQGTQPDGSSVASV